MKSPIHLLHLEDDPEDASIVKTTLEAEGVACEITRVQNQNDFVAMLERGGIDLVLSDFSLPTFDGMSALAIVRERWPGVPVIILSGSLGEEQAIDSLKLGATDYVLKQRLSRLGPAIRRALKEVEERNERRKLETQVIESQKMEVIGQLAGGVAHDFNNILAVIMGYTSLMLEEKDLRKDFQTKLGTIQGAAERAAGLTRQLLIFSRKQVVEAVVLDLGDVVRNLEAILRRLIDENIQMTILPGKEAGYLKADSGYLDQVLMNLVVNARDAMPNGGQLTITTENLTLDENYVRSHRGARAGKYVMLSVSDTGTGMTPEVKEHLFEAFFTTKPKGKGTGLGLATCQSIVEQSAGYIDVSSELGEGTTFKIYFPRVDPLWEVPSKDLNPQPMPRGTATVLVVEDDSALRHLAQVVLQEQGYTVIAAANGQEALGAVDAHEGPPISLVITDVIMPLMGGRQMAEWLKITDPNLKVLFTSGYTDETLMPHGILDAGVAFLPKPYLPAGLTHKVHDMLKESVIPAEVKIT